MDKELEFAKKIALLRKLVREGLLTEQEYSKVRQRLINIGGEIEEVPDNTQKQNKRRKRRSRINPVVTTGERLIVFKTDFRQSFIFSI